MENSAIPRSSPAEQRSRRKQLQLPLSTNASRFGGRLQSMVARGASSQRFQTLRQLFIDAAEAAIGEYRHYVTRAHFGSYRLDDCVGVRREAGTPSLLLQVGHEGGHVHTLTLGDGFRFEYVRDHDLIGYRQTPRQFILKEVAAERVGPRLQNGPQP